MRVSLVSFAITLFTVAAASATALRPGSILPRDKLPTRVSNLNPAPKVVRDVPSTNSARFSRGLPPLPPRRRSGVFARQVQPSSCPASNKQGRWQVRSAQSGDVLGYIGDDYGTTGALSVLPGDASGGLSEATPVSPKFLAYSCHPNIDPFLGLTSSPEWLVAAIPSDSPTATFGPSSNGFAFGAKTSTQTAHGSPPQTISTTAGTTQAETSIWSYNPTTNAITAQWVNPDGSTNPTYFAVANVDGEATLVLTGNVGYVQSVYPGSTPEGYTTEQVTITFI